MDRRDFLSTLACSLVAYSAAPLSQVKSAGSCWLEVCAPFILEDAARDLRCEIILTSDTFAGAQRPEQSDAATEYEIYLYDFAGKAMVAGGVAKRLTAPAMRTTVIPVSELIGETKSFWGGMKIRLRPTSRNGRKGSPMPHVADLFSSAFVRWRASVSFDNIHANPDPPQWQNTESYFYSMPFPSLAEYDCVFSLFNPNDQRSAGEITLNDSHGRRFASYRYELKPHTSLLFDLNAGKATTDPWKIDLERLNKSHGLLAVANEPGTTKSFGYLMIRQRERARFSVEHPIHQGVFKPKPAASPFDDKEQFKARNVLYSPLLFKARKIAGLTFDSRFYFGAGLPLEETQWFYPFAVDGEGNAAWSSLNDQKLAECLPAQTEWNVIKLAAGQSCALDFKGLSLDQRFAGGLAVAVSPETTHTLLKVEVKVQEWNAHAFTHFRPGLRSARGYQKAKERGGMATDYIISGARLVRHQGVILADEVIAVINIDDQGRVANPTLELFGQDDPRCRSCLPQRLLLGTIPPFACRHFLLSDLIKFVGDDVDSKLMTLRLVDQQATLLMSAIHLDFKRRDLALDHGSDRFSTFLDYGC